MNTVQTYNAACFSFLVYEFGCDEENETNKKIRRKLSSSKLGEFDLDRAQRLRSLKNELQNEISKYQNSKYYLGPHGSYADMADFDTDRIFSDYSQKYPSLVDEMTGFVGFAIYAYYLR